SRGSVQKRSPSPSGRGCRDSRRLTRRVRVARSPYPETLTRALRGRKFYESKKYRRAGSFYLLELRTIACSIPVEPGTQVLSVLDRRVRPLFPTDDTLG